MFIVPASTNSGKRFWRIYNATGEIIDATEVTVYASAGATGSGLFTGGVATAQSEYNSDFLASYWTDKSTSTQWYPATGGHWWQYETTVGIEPVELVFVSTINLPGLAISSFSVWYSETGVNESFIKMKEFAASNYGASEANPITGGTLPYKRYSLV